MPWHYAQQVNQDSLSVNDGHVNYFCSRFMPLFLKKIVRFLLEFNHYNCKHLLNKYNYKYFWQNCLFKFAFIDTHIDRPVTLGLKVRLLSLTSFPS